MVAGLGSVLPGGAGRAGAGAGGCCEGSGRAAGVAGAGGLAGPREVDGPSRRPPGRRLATPPEKVRCLGLGTDSMRLVTRNPQSRREEKLLRCSRTIPILHGPGYPGSKTGLLLIKNAMQEADHLAIQGSASRK